MIQLTQDEQNAVNLLGIQAQQLQSQLKQVNDAQMSVVKLLELKYNASFNQETGKLEPKKEN